MKNDLLEAITLEQALHPQANQQDILKLIKQACFGVKHLQLSEQDSLYLFKEEKKIANHALQNPQYIGNGFCRVPLSFMSEEHLPLWNLLFMATMHHGEEDNQLFQTTIATLEESLHFDDDTVTSRDGIHHSAKYRELYQPHYRVIKQEYVNYFEVLLYIWESICSKQETHIGIDGRCASGKTTVARAIEEIFHLHILHMDDYFLPNDKRTEQRLQEVGGNIDYERFLKEVIQPLCEHKEIMYQRYDCQRGQMEEGIKIPYQKCTIWEGSYAHHPSFANALQVRIFVTCESSIQKRRLMKRSFALYERFIKEWIPKEEQYFETFHIKEKSDIILNTSRM